MRDRLLATLGALLLAACAAANPPSVTVESTRFPGVTIECGGDPGLTERRCLTWAEQLLPGRPIETARLVLTYRAGNARCAADYFAANGRALMSSAARCPPP